MNCCYIYTTQNIMKSEANSYINFYEDLLIKSIETLLKFYKNDINKLYILIDNQADRERINFIMDIINSINDNSINIIYKFIDLGITKIIKYPENNMNKLKINRIGLLKFFIPYLVDVDDILYIDCDILFNGNVIDNIFENFDSNTLFKMFQGGKNSGLILFNCNKWRQDVNILNTIKEFYNNNEDIETVDESMFRWLVNNYDDVIKDYNWKIDFPIVKNKFNGIINDLNMNLEYYKDIWKEMNIIHLYGWYNEKHDFYKIYNYIMSNG